MAKAKNRISSLRTVGTFLNGRACSDALFRVLNCAFDHPMQEEERATMPFAGGIMQHGYQCGMIWGASLGGGVEVFRRFGACPEAETRAIAAARRLVESFRAENEEINCLELTDIDQSSTATQMITHFLVKGGAIRCFRMSAAYAPAAFRDIEAALAEDPVDAPSDPVSCSALLARRVGASDMHAVTVAGLAGGIGLSGGGCGALGAAIWIAAMRRLKGGARKLDFKDPKALDIINRFLKCTNYELECSQIVGRKFEDVHDHANHLREGGCSTILDVLVSQALADA
jgi:hypothetical protein